MRNRIIPLFLMVVLSFPSCMHESPAEQALNQLRQARYQMRQVDSDRESAGTFVPIQQKIIATLSAFNEVAACQCVIYPLTLQTVNENADKSLTYGEEIRVQIHVLITLNLSDVWRGQRARDEVAALLRDNEFEDFTLSEATQSGLTWIVNGSSPWPSPATQPLHPFTH